jgi:PAS domain S-box-containing protein
MDLRDDPTLPQDLADGTSIDVLFVGTGDRLLEELPADVEASDRRIRSLTASSAAAARDFIEGRDVDCIVAAYDLPDGDGLELLNVAESVDAPISTILYPDDADETVAIAAIECDVTACVPRGGERDDSDHLVAAIDRSVTDDRARRTADRAFRAMASAREGISLLDEDGYIVYVNDAYCELSGYSRERLLDSHWELLYPDGHAERVYDEILPTVREEHRWDGETVYEKPDGSRTLVSHAMADTPGGDLICLVRDVGNRATERELFRERQRMGAFVDAVDEYAIFMLDPGGYVVSWNEGAKAIKGYESDQILGDHYATFFTGEDQEDRRPEALLATARDDGVVEDEGWRVRADGSTFWARAVLTAVTRDGEHRGYVMVTEDKTERRELHERIAAERAFFEDAIDALEDLFYVLDPDGSIRQVNRRAVEATGYSEEELTSMTVWDVFDPESHADVDHSLEQAMEEGVGSVQLELHAKDGSATPYEFRSSPLDGGNGEVEAIVGIARDVTERLERQQRLAVLNRVLRHNLRNKLTTISGRAREIGERTTDESTREAADDVVDASAELLDIAETARSFQRLRADGPHEAEVDPAECMPSLLEELEERHPDAAIETDFRGTTNVVVDPRFLRLIVGNLAENAIKHNDAPEPRVDVRIRATDGDGVVIEVADDGPGIPEREIHAVQDVEEDSLEHGTGIGLFVVQWCTTALDGEIEFGTDTEGTTVTVEL